jgi:prepilin-type N-terminal cleavage/methylation domain-containing protein
MKLKAKNGFTLIEVIVSIAIIGIITITFLSIFTTGYKTIMNSGHRSADDFSTQTKVENALNSAPATNSGLTITLPGPTTITADGEVKSLNTGQVTITFFAPLN